MLDDERNNILGTLYVYLAILRLKCEFWLKRINEIEILKEEVKNNEDKLLTDLEYEKKWCIA